MCLNYLLESSTVLNLSKLLHVKLNTCLHHRSHTLNVVLVLSDFRDKESAKQSIDQVSY